MKSVISHTTSFTTIQQSLSCACFLISSTATLNFAMALEVSRMWLDCVESTMTYTLSFCTWVMAVVWLVQALRSSFYRGFCRRLSARSPVACTQCPATSKGSMPTLSTSRQLTLAQTLHDSHERRFPKLHYCACVRIRSSGVAYRT
jgi:hypothetical protein